MFYDMKSFIDTNNGFGQLEIYHEIWSLQRIFDWFIPYFNNPRPVISVNMKPTISMYL